MELDRLKNIYKDKKVFLTGHTGFKGSWLAKILTMLGAEVKGYSLKPNTNPNHLELLNIDIHNEINDIRDLDALTSSVKKFNPEIIFHLAAQPLVRYSYKNPIETYQTNVMGVLNILEAIKSSDSVKAFINITTDKCYENKEWDKGYVEEDAMGGYDPYSSSKACSEILTASYRNSFFNLEDYKTKHNCLVASARAGNVIGGGDWSEDRLVPDIIRSVSSEQKLKMRNPSSVRPWQHVLEPLHGYLLLGEKLLLEKLEYASAWNFGPNYKDCVEVQEVVKKTQIILTDFDYEFDVENGPHEAKLLKLDSAKAIKRLDWVPKWNIDQTIDKTMNWYKDYMSSSKINTEENIIEFFK